MIRYSERRILMNKYLLDIMIQVISGLILYLIIKFVF
uniref:Uncharacterized protein n=1 Tax=Myoviridae sp. ctIty1 TaxID=2827673 RepID=A0A8S5TGH8_9CAUD|nr:MAG TPA: hypothetical protein [Myoviridae sp. ctIty1]